MTETDTVPGRGAPTLRALGARAVLAGPGLLYITLFMTVPLLIIASYAFLTRGRFGGVRWEPTLENFTKALDSTYLSILGNSVLIAGITTVLALALGYPTAAVTVLSYDGAWADLDEADASVTAFHVARA